MGTLGLQVGKIFKKGRIWLEKFEYIFWFEDDHLCVENSDFSKCQIIFLLHQHKSQHLVT